MLFSMTTTTAPYITALANLNSDSVTKAKVIAAAVSVAVATHLSLPSTPLESAGAYYAEQHALCARELISMFNEVQPLDLPAALTFTRYFWQTRYDAVFCKRFTRVSPGEFFASFCGATYHFSSEDIAFFNEQGAAIFAIAAAACDVVCAKQQAETGVAEANAAASVEPNDVAVVVSPNVMV